MRKILKFKLEFIVFVSGAVVMIFEIVGSRVLGPFLGTSIFIWTSLIGVILGSLSLGYWLGGKMADRSPAYKTLSAILFMAALLVAFSTFIKDGFLVFLIKHVKDLRWSSVIAAVLLFAPASVLLGMVSPYAVKLKIKSLEKSGRTVGNLYAISTVGSIVGTFLAGFLLIPFLGTTRILYLLCITLIIISALSYARKSVLGKGIMLMIFAFFLFSNTVVAHATRGRVLDVDTLYSRVWVFDTVDQQSQKPVKFMRINSQSSSAMFLNEEDDNELVFDYGKFYRLSNYFKEEINKALMIGGAAYTYPRDFLRKNPQATIDVVEIDPGLTKLAQDFFRLKPDERMRIFHEDARVFLNRSQEKYDVIFGDAFTSIHSLPYQLTTEEAVRLKYEMLNDGGVVLVNIISAIEGEKGEFLRAEYHTYKKVFPQVYVFPVKEMDDAGRLQNLMLVAVKSQEEFDFHSDDPELSQYLEHLWTKTIPLDIPVLLDEHAPVDYLANKAL